MSECVKCGQEIGNASYCGCGWKRQTKADREQLPPRELCAYMACSKPSICKVKVSTTAWSHYCHEHYLAHFQAHAEETCERLGLKTVAQKRTYVLEKMKAGVFKRMPREREPGEDREEAA